MIESIAMWGGIAGLVVSIFAIVILFLTRHSILDILNKDAILFDNNFEIKKNAISTALSLVDEINDKGEFIKNNEEFSKKAKQCYNDLLCVLSDVRIADQFYNIALDKTVAFNEARNAQFKLLCRSDIGLKTKHSMLMKRLQQTNSVKPVQNVQVQSQPVQPVFQQAETVQQPLQQPQMQQASSQQTMSQATQPIQQRIIPQSTAQPTRQIRPTASTQQSRPVVRPVAPAQQTVRRITPPKNEN